MKTARCRVSTNRNPRARRKVQTLERAGAVNSTIFTRSISWCRQWSSSSSIRMAVGVPTLLNWEIERSKAEMGKQSLSIRILVLEMKLIHCIHRKWSPVLHWTKATVASATLAVGPQGLSAYNSTPLSSTFCRLYYFGAGGAISKTAKWKSQVQASLTNTRHQVHPHQISTLAHSKEVPGNKCRQWSTTQSPKTTEMGWRLDIHSIQLTTWNHHTIIKSLTKAVSSNAPRLTLQNSTTRHRNKTRSSPPSCTTSQSPRKLIHCCIIWLREIKNHQAGTNWKLPAQCPPWQQIQINH